MTDSPKMSMPPYTSVFSRTPRELRINCEDSVRRRTPGHMHKKTTPVISPPMMPKKKILLRHSNYLMKMSSSATPTKVKNSIGVQTDLMFSLLPFPFPYAPTNLPLVPPPPLILPPPPPPSKRHRYPLRNMKNTQNSQDLELDHESDEERYVYQDREDQTEEVTEERESHPETLPTVKVIPPVPSQYHYPSLKDRMGGTRKRKRIGSESPSEEQRTFRHRKRLPDGYLDRDKVEKKFGQKTRNSLSSVDILKNWFLDSLSYPYPTKDEKANLQKETGLTLIQITNWCSNCRKRIWRPSVMEKDREVRETSFTSFDERLPPKKRRKV